MSNFKMDDLTNLTETVPNATELIAASLDLEPKELREQLPTGVLCHLLPGERLWTSAHEKQVLRDSVELTLGKEHAQRIFGDSKTFDECDAIAAQKIEAFKTWEEAQKYD